ncbi:MAG: siroheme decarboxylase subunit beta [Planctomycetota bacterium]|jgi:DNA-binding Lrp family transcriptional regulator
MNVSEKNLSDLEQRILGVIQHGMPMSVNPYQDLADKIEIPVEQLLEILHQWQADGKIRRLGAIVNHFQMGHGVGAMVVWTVPDDRVQQVGELFASFPRVSHAYQRPSQEQWPYNLYTMVHATSKKELTETIRTMSQKSGIAEYRDLKTVKELKKVPPTYIIEQ